MSKKALLLFGILYLTVSLCKETAAGQLLPFIIRFSTINFSRSISKTASKRGWNDDYIQYVFAPFPDKDVQKRQCVICYKVLGSDSLRPSTLSNYLLKIHPEYKDKGIAFFERKRDALKRAKLDPSATYYKENISQVEASYEVALTIAKQKKPHTIAKTLVKQCAIKMVERVNKVAKS